MNDNICRIDDEVVDSPYEDYEPTPDPYDQEPEEDIERGLA